MQRLGECKRCGRCCKRWTPVDGEMKEVTCDFLYFDNGVASCAIYEARSDECRKYPAGPENRRPGCGYSFAEECTVNVL